MTLKATQEQPDLSEHVEMHEKEGKRGDDQNRRDLLNGVIHKIPLNLTGAQNQGIELSFGLVCLPVFSTAYIGTMTLRYTTCVQKKRMEKWHEMRLAEKREKVLFFLPFTP